MKYNVLLLLTAFFININSAQAEMLPPAPPRMISVTGEAREEIVPDQAILSGQLVSKAKQLSVAKTENDKLVKQVLAVAKEFDLPKDKISASNVYITPDLIWDQATQKQNKIGYIVSRNLTLTMDNMAIHEKVLSALLEGGIDQINGVNFIIAEPEAHADKLRVKALQNARARAQMLAEAAGATLGKVIFISNSSAMAQPPMPVMGRAMAMMKQDSAGAPSLPGMVNLEESVSVTYELQ
jgi:uncharacterized protein YggE